MIQLTLTEDERSIFEKKLVLAESLVNRYMEEKKALVLRVDQLEQELARLNIGGKKR